jgi:hypothetical protein
MPDGWDGKGPNPVDAKQGDRWYSLYFNGHSNDDIAADFEERHGYKPDIIIETGGGKLAGPLKTEQSIGGL